MMEEKEEEIIENVPEEKEENLTKEKSEKVWLKLICKKINNIDKYFINDLLQ